MIHEVVRAMPDYAVLMLIQKGDRSYTYAAEPVLAWLISVTDGGIVTHIEPITLHGSHENAVVKEPSGRVVLPEVEAWPDVESWLAVATQRALDADVAAKLAGR